MELSIQQAYATTLKLIVDEDYVQAEKFLKAILDKFPEDEPARVALARLAIKIEKLDTALKILKQGLKMQPNSQNFWLEIANILLKNLEVAVYTEAKASRHSPKEYEQLRDLLIIPKGDYNLQKVKDQICKSAFDFTDQNVLELTQGCKGPSSIYLIENLLKATDNPTVYTHYAELMLLYNKPFTALKYIEMVLLNEHFTLHALQIFSNSLFAVNAFDACLYSVNCAIDIYGDS